ncbi:MAG: hypothetical protein KTR30_17750 [Saprospiraceae bacterium]|nr:hypothetical protein [Saprospiraceae bacterium]
MNRFISIIALCTVPLQLAWAQQDTTQLDLTSKHTCWFESNAILESLKAIQLSSTEDRQLSANQTIILVAQDSDTKSNCFNIQPSRLPGHLTVAYRLKEISTVLLTLRASDKSVVWKAPVMHRAADKYTEELDLNQLQPGEYQISLVTEFGTYKRQLSILIGEQMGAKMTKLVKAKDLDNPE